MYNDYAKRCSPIYVGTRLYMATFENLKTDNRKFRAWNDFKAAERAAKISSENEYGKILSIYELHPRTLKIIRSAGRRVTS